MDLVSKIFIKFSCHKVGVDEFGNQYFEAKKAINGVKKRCVIYKGLAEPSKVPAEWHGWLHYTTNDLPGNYQKKYYWQKIHLPNLTGTKFAYFPKKHRVSSEYQPWQPNQ
jgi:NADH:ubiquinone oxidoreductase subunit